MALVNKISHGQVLFCCDVDISIQFSSGNVSGDSCYQDLSLKGASVLLKSDLALKLVFALCSAAAVEEKQSHVPVSELQTDVVIAAHGMWQVGAVAKL